MTTEIAEAQKLSGIFQTFTTGKAVAPDVQDKCNGYMTALMNELSNNRLKYIDYGIAFRTTQREVVRNELSRYIVEVLFLIDDGRRPFPYAVLTARIYSIFDTDKNEFFYVMKKELGAQVGEGNLPAEAFAYLTNTIHIPVASSEQIGMELRDLKAFIWHGDKKATEGRGFRDIILKHAKGLQESSFSTLANVTIGLVESVRRRREAYLPL
jgi:hypothetical protein